jgi:hypothetical protein
MFVVLLTTFAFLLNTAGALGIHALVDDSVRERYLNSVWVKVLLLIPPVSIVLAFITLSYGVLFLIYLALSNYFSNN